MGGLILAVTGILTAVQALPAPAGGVPEAVLVGIGRLFAGLLILLGALIQGYERRLGGVLTCLLGLAILVVDVAVGDYRSWAVVCYAGPLLTVFGGLWAVATPYFDRVSPFAAGILLVVSALFASLGQESVSSVAFIAAAVFFAVVAVRLLWHPMLAPGFGLFATAVGVAALAWLVLIGLLVLAGVFQATTGVLLIVWPFALIGAWLLFTNALRLPATTSPRWVNALGALAGLSLLAGALWLLIAPGLGDPGVLIVAGLAVLALWTLSLGTTWWRAGPPGVAA
jgi:hypothetical protein